IAVQNLSHLGATGFQAFLILRCHNETSPGLPLNSPPNHLFTKVGCSQVQAPDHPSEGVRTGLPEDSH
ncbi:MAG: hypothetical protein AAF827_20000, partial [Cyanobacteria bacterium P01_D01_bin.6]